MDEWLAGLVRDRDLLVDGRAWPNHVQVSGSRANAGGWAGPDVLPARWRDALASPCRMQRGLRCTVALCLSQDYHPMVQLAKQHRLPVVCANAPRRRVTRVHHPLSGPQLTEAQHAPCFAADSALTRGRKEQGSSPHLTCGAGDRAGALPPRRRTAHRGCRGMSTACRLAD